MQRIDAHQHFWVFDPVRDSWITDDMAKIRADFLPGDLAPLLKENKIGGCIAVQAEQSLGETDFLLNLAAKNDFIKGVVGWVDLKSPRLEQILSGYQGNTLLKGFRHILQGVTDLPAFFEDGLFEKGLHTILDKGYSYDLLVYHHQLARIMPLVERLSARPDNGQVKSCKLVLDHIGKPDLKTGAIKQWKKHIQELAAFKNVYCKVSGLVTEADFRSWKPEDLKGALDTVLEAFGVDRLMFGSDWPVCLVATGYGKWVEVLENYFSDLSQEAISAIFGGNAARFYGIDNQLN
jgi:L-fuconolactonase